MDSRRVGVIGLGLMGTAISRCLLEAGYSVNVWNRTREKAEPLLAAGAVWSSEFRVARFQSEVIVVHLGLPGDVPRLGAVRVVAIIAIRRSVVRAIYIMIVGITCRCHFDLSEICRQRRLHNTLTRDQAKPCSSASQAQNSLD